MKEERQLRSNTRSIIGIIIFAVISLLLLWYAADLLLLAFLSILFAIFLRSLSDPLANKLRCPERLMLWVVMGLMLGSLSLAAFLYSAKIAEQFQELSDRLPKAIGELKQAIESSQLGRQLFQQSVEIGGLLQRPGVLSRATGVLSATFGFFSSIIVVLVAGIFFANSPRLYLEGAIRLFIPQTRARMREVLQAVYQTMRWWLFGKAISMVFIAFMTWVGLQFLGINFALLLALAAGLLAFIPYIGPLLSAVPAVLLALVESPQSALHVAGLYVGIQIIEGNVLTPLVERKTVHLPPALTIFSQLLAALLFGFLGVLLASPLLAAGMVIVRMLYIEDHLEREESDL